ncbi:hypothetical protein CFAM422_013372 [Trichoderma lentiforme]|uniref:Major facilitator superfamily (MFS) profile domain-containing protein n=1 Tax=Trichoderma lentiforme TaxID=1567552 RepID=A0A9P4X293_9HYPO|nr:hypothetical protein CFAM422_013372 [Trichoderma lentiforme]
MGRGRRVPTKLLEEDYLVDFDGLDDPLYPVNWKAGTKTLIACTACAGTMQAAFASATFAPAASAASQELGVSTEVGNLGTALYILGFAFGPVIWAPASERFGRSWPLKIGMFGDAIFLIGSATATNIQTLLICRFFSAVFAASTLSVVPGVLADLYDHVHRGIAVTVYALTLFTGPFTAPFIGAFITKSNAGWRWTLYLPALIGFVILAAMLGILEETYEPVLLQQKAAAIRHDSQNWAVHSRLDTTELKLKDLLQVHFLRPIRMLFTEPVLLFFTLYMSFIYGLVYATVEAFPYIFETNYGMDTGINALPLLSLVVGQVIGLGFVVWQLSSSYANKLATNNGVPVPEWRLVPPLVGSPVFVVGLFW